MIVRIEGVPEDGDLPLRYAKNGENVSPPVMWSDAPPDTSEFVVVLQQMASGIQSPFIHWVVYGIPGDKRRLPEGLGHQAKPDPNAVQGKNSLGNVGYDGPSRVAGRPMSLSIRIIALNARLNLEPGLEHQAVLEAIPKERIAGDARAVVHYVRRTAA